MDAQEKIQVLKKMIANEQKLIHWSIGLTISILIIGLTASVFAYYSGFNKSTDWLGESSKLLSGIPVLLGTALGFFPVKDYFVKQNKIVSFLFLKNRYEAMQTDSSDMNSNDMAEIEKRFFTLLDKNLS